MKRRAAAGCVRFSESKVEQRTIMGARSNKCMVHEVNVLWLSIFVALIFGFASGQTTYHLEEFSLKELKVRLFSVLVNENGKGVK